MASFGAPCRRLRGRCGTPSLLPGSHLTLLSLKWNHDGRADGTLLEGPTFEAGRYRPVSPVAAYFRRRGAELPDLAFLDEVPLDFGLSNPDRHCHLPLLASPWACST